MLWVSSFHCCACFCSLYVIVPIDSVLLQPPTEYDVYRVLKHKAVKWNSIGRALGVEFNDREKIEKTFGLDFEDKLERVLHMWIEYRCSEVTWQNVLDVLEELKFIDTIQSVKEYLAKPEIMNRYSQYVLTTIHYLSVLFMCSR